MPNEITFLREAHDRRLTAAAAISAGECYQLGDGRASFRNSTSQGSASADSDCRFRDTGIATVIKTAGVVILDGGRVYWDHSANSATYRTVNDRDFFIGTAVGDAASADTTMAVNLNVAPVYDVDLLARPHLSQSVWTTEATNGLGTTLLLGGGVQASFDAVTEAAQAAAYSERTFVPDCKGILEVRFAIFDIGDNAALDINIGVANGSHATNFDSVTERISFHLDGNSLDIYLGSTDGTNTVAYTDTTINAVDDTYIEGWIDFRNRSAIKSYLDGAVVLNSTTFSLAEASGLWRPIVHVEKSSDDTTADVRLAFMRWRTMQQKYSG